MDGLQGPGQVLTGITQPLIDCQPVPAIDQLHNRLPQILDDSVHSEMFGVPLVPISPDAEPDVPTRIVLNKFLRANNNNVDRAGAHLTAALVWRRSTDPLTLANKVFSREKFESIGAITAHRPAGEQE